MKTDFTLVCVLIAGDGEQGTLANSIGSKACIINLFITQSYDLAALINHTIASDEIC